MTKLPSKKNKAKHLEAKKGVWIKLPKELVGLTETAVKVLVIQEKTGRFKGLGIWKFPTGVVNEGEYIHDGSVREVKEETGVDTEFVQILALRQTHKAFFEKSDLFFMCMLKPLSLEINAHETEIEAARWMPWGDTRNNHLYRMTEIGSAKTNGEYAGLTPLRVSAPDQHGILYFNSRDLTFPPLTFLNKQSSPRSFHKNLVSLLARYVSIDI